MTERSEGIVFNGKKQFGERSICHHKEGVPKGHENLFSKGENLSGFSQAPDYMRQVKTEININ
jgi:hypothetical protein